MRATQELRDEHRGIERMLGILTRVSDRLERGERVEPAHLERSLEFLQVFADRCHHGKEEEHLFPALERAGVPVQRGPIGVMLAEHEEGRSFIRGLADSIGRYAAGEAAAGVAIAGHARNYVELLTAHIGKEDNVLFPMADARLEALDGELVEAFERIEEERIGAGKHEEFHRLLDELEGVYNRQTA